MLATPTYGFRDHVAGEMLGPTCTTCHSPASPYWPAHHLDLTSYAGLMAGGRSAGYETIVPCRPESSLVWNKITQEVPWVGDPMPPRDAPVAPDILERIRTWILEGAPDDP